MSLNKILPSLIPLSTSAPAYGPSAAEKLYRIPELRQRVLYHLEKADLARCMRVEKGCMAAVARELYHTMTRDQVLKMGNTTETEELYCSCIRIINADAVVVTDEDRLSVPRLYKLSERRWKAFQARREADSGIMFSPTMFGLIVPPLRNKCPGATQLNVGCTEELGSTWVVDFDPPGITAAAAGLDDPGGSITQRVGYNFKPEDAPPTSNSSYPPILGYRSILRFSLSIQPVKARRDAWLDALVTNPIFGGVCWSLVVKHLPITLAHLSVICEQRAKSGNMEPLEDILIDNISPWSIADLRNFAAVASTSLRCLHLFGGVSSDVTFANLVDLIPIIRDHLPNLDELGVRIEGDENGTICRSMLSSTLLEPGGALQYLVIVIGIDLTSRVAFDLIRCVSPLVTSKARLHIRSGMEEDKGEAHRQTSFLRYLRSQPQHRRIHLSTTDFPSLGFPTITSISDLQYYDDGRPKHRTTADAARYLATVNTANRGIQSHFSPHLCAALSDMVNAARELETSTAGGIGPQTLKQMQNVLLAMETAEGWQRSIDGAMVAISQRKKELAKSIEAMQQAGRAD